MTKLPVIAEFLSSIGTVAVRIAKFPSTVGIATLAEPEIDREWLKMGVGGIG
jgi:hypothetical protein